MENVGIILKTETVPSLSMISRILTVSTVGTVYSCFLIGLSQTSRPLASPRRNDVVEQWEPEAKIDYTDGDAATKYTEDGQEIS
jgi:hypothetical protein